MTNDVGTLFENENTKEKKPNRFTRYTGYDQLSIRMDYMQLKL